MLYKLAHAESCKRVVAAECNRRFAISVMIVRGWGGGCELERRWEGKTVKVRSQGRGIGSGKSE